MAEGECHEQETWEPAWPFSFRIAGSGSWSVQTARFTVGTGLLCFLEHFECQASRRVVFQETETSTGCCFAQI